MADNKTSMPRREFLQAIGRSAGSAAMLRTMAALGISSGLAACGSSSASPLAPAGPPPPPPPAAMPVSPRPGDWPANIGVGRSVAILGGGIAGMTAALELSRLGYDCTLLEAQPQAGGRNRTLRSGDAVNEVDSSQQCLFDVGDNFYFNAGPSRISHHHEFLLGYCREFGIALETFINHNSAARLHDPSRFGGEAKLVREIESNASGHIAALLATAINQGALDQQLTATDRNNVLRMLQQLGDLDPSFNFNGSSRAGFPAQEMTGSRQRGELLPPLALQDLVSDTFLANGLSFADGLQQQATMLQPVGGMDTIARAFESAVLNDIRFEAIVSEIRKTTNGTRVVYDQMGASTTLETDYALVTIPAPVLAGISNDFSTAHQNEIASFQYTSAVRLAFQSRRFWEQDLNIYGGISWTNQPITQVWYPNHGFGDDNGVFLGAYIFGGLNGDSFTNMTPQQRLDAALTQGGNLHPEIATEAARGISVAWKKMPFQLGAWGSSTPSTLLTADDNIFFAGEHLSILQGWQEGAILSAYHAIDGIVARDSA